MLFILLSLAVLTVTNYILSTYSANLIAKINLPRFAYNLIIAIYSSIYKIIILFLSFQNLYPISATQALLASINIELFILIAYSLFEKKKQIASSYFIALASLISFTYFIIFNSLDTLLALILFSLFTFFHYFNLKREREFVYKKESKISLFIPPIAAFTVVVMSFVLSYAISNVNLFYKVLIFTLPDVGVILNRKLLRTFVAFNILFTFPISCFFSIYQVSSFYYILLSNFLLSIALLTIDMFIKK